MASAGRQRVSVGVGHTPACRSDAWGSVDAEWIVAKKDYQEAKKKQKAREMSMSTSSAGPQDSENASQEMPPSYQPEMDEMRCVLYAHGGTCLCRMGLRIILSISRWLLLW